MKIKRALLSVSDKKYIDRIAQTLHQNGVQIISSGGTGAYLSTFNIPWTPVEEITGNPEAFGGRMKTLSFQILSSLLYNRENPRDIEEASKLGIEAIDLVICNLYPFVETYKQTNEHDQLIEKIDIGGPSMIRAAAKNYQAVTVVIDPEDYDELEKEIESDEISLRYRKKMALKAFRHTAEYDSSILLGLESSLNNEQTPPSLIHADITNAKELRYGENPHQWAKLVANEMQSEGLAHAKPIHGKALSYNNYLDADAAIRSCSDLHQRFPGQSIVSVIKHANPCGIAVAKTPDQALEFAWNGDKISSFGSIIAFNQEVNLEAAKFLSTRFVEVIIAPSFDSSALALLKTKKNLRLLCLKPTPPKETELMIRTISGGWVIQSEDTELSNEIKPVTDNKESNFSEGLLTFGVLATKHLKSNAISLVSERDGVLFMAGAGMGNPNRLVSVEQAISKARENDINPEKCLLISDAFFPFRDNIDLLVAHGITTVVQPGGSIKDNEVVEACNQNDMVMYFTGKRHFRH